MRVSALVGYTILIAACNYAIMYLRYNAVIDNPLNIVSVLASGGRHKGN
jgi:hypothetical protein